MRKLNCNVVRDLLPLYADAVVCEDTRDLVDEHLAECDGCRQELKAMCDQIVIPLQTDEVKSLKKFKHKWNLKQNIKGALATLLVISLLIAGFQYMYKIGFPVKAENVKIRSGLQCVQQYGVEWNEVTCPTDIQSWVIDIGVHNGDLRVKPKTVWGEDSSGDPVVKGVKFEVRWFPITFPWVSAGQDWVDENGMITYIRLVQGTSDTELYPRREDYTVTFSFSDQEITYSIEESGLYDNTAVHSGDICPFAR